MIKNHLNIYHIYKGDSSSSARIKMEMFWLKGKSLDINIKYFWYAVIKSLFKKKAVAIFHGQSTLPYLILLTCFRNLFFRNIRFVYDMHDLNERPIRGSHRAFLRYRLFYTLEYLVAQLGIEVITVSKGLSRIFFRRFGVSPKVVYNVAFEVDTERCLRLNSLGTSDRTGVVYFGLIKPDRTPLHWVAEVCTKQKAGVFDVYGRFPKGDFTAFSGDLDRLAAQTSLRLCGPYKPEAMGFLEKYRYSWLCFESDRLNIRYCMPNKLFQSLSAGLCCVISDRLVEARTLFGDACVSYRDFLQICEGKLESPAGKIDWKDVEERMQKVAERSRAVFLEVCGAHRSVVKEVVVDDK